jgi:hypothetical protein
MLIGSIRPRETRTADVQGTSLEDVYSELEKERPVGFALVKAPVRMIKGAPIIEATGTFDRFDSPTDIEAEDLDALIERVPEGWQLLSVRRV